MELLKFKNSKGFAFIPVLIISLMALASASAVLVYKNKIIHQPANISPPVVQKINNSPIPSSSVAPSPAVILETPKPIAKPFSEPQISISNVQRISNQTPAPEIITASETPSPTPSPTIDQQALLLEYLKQQKAQEREAARIAAEQEAQRLKDEIAAKQSQLAQMKVECDDPINQLKLQQTKIKSDYYSKVAEIQNKPISMSSINSQIIQLTNDANIQLGQIDAQLQQLALQCSTKYGN